MNIFFFRLMVVNKRYFNNDPASKIIKHKELIAFILFIYIYILYFILSELKNM